MSLNDVIVKFPEDLQAPMQSFALYMQDNLAVSHEDFSQLREVVGELADAQKRTELRVEELADAQKRTEVQVAALASSQVRLEQTMNEGFQRVYNLIATLGSRWGIQTEQTFRNVLRGILGKTDYTVSQGYYGGREVDVVVQGNNLHILVEITSSLRKGDVPKYIASADDYESQTGISPVIMVAASHVSPSAIPEISAAPRPIELYSTDDDI
jgi:hypothetical protein